MALTYDGKRTRPKKDDQIVFVDCAQDGVCMTIMRAGTPLGGIAPGRRFDHELFFDDLSQEDMLRVANVIAAVAGFSCEKIRDKNPAEAVAVARLT